MAKKAPIARTIFRMDADPFANDPPEASEFYAALGRAAVVWGLLEVNISELLNYIGQVPEAKSILDPDADGISVSFKRKAELWRTAFKKLAFLSPIKADALAFMQNIRGTKLAYDRNLLTHSLWQECASTTPLAFRMVNADFKGSRTVYSELIVSIDDLNHFTNAVHQISRGMANNIYWRVKSLCAEQRANQKP